MGRVVSSLLLHNILQSASNYSLLISKLLCWISWKRRNPDTQATPVRNFISHVRRTSNYGDYVNFDVIRRPRVFVLVAAMGLPCCIIPGSPFGATQPPGDESQRPGNHQANVITRPDQPNAHYILSLLRLTGGFTRTPSLAMAQTLRNNRCAG